MKIEKNKNLERKKFLTPRRDFFWPPAELKIYFFHLKMKIGKNIKFEKKKFWPPAENFLTPLEDSRVWQLGGADDVAFKIYEKT